MQRLTISIGDQHWAKLRELREKTGIGFAEAVRRGIDVVCQHNESVAAPSVQEREPGSDGCGPDARIENSKPPQPEPPSWECPPGVLNPRIAALIRLLRGQDPDLAIPDLVAEYSSHGITPEAARVAVVEALRFKDRGTIR